MGTCPQYCLTLQVAIPIDSRLFTVKRTMKANCQESVKQFNQN